VVTEPESSLYLWLYSPLLDLGCFFSFLILYTVGTTPWTGDQPVARPLPARTGQHKHRIKAHRHPCLKWDLKQSSQCLSGRKQFMPKTTPPLGLAPEGSTLPIAKPATGHDTEPVPSTSHPHNLLPYDPSGSRTRRFNTVNTKTRHWTRYRASSIHFREFALQPIKRKTEARY
jgi:hypothetical protein